MAAPVIAAPRPRRPSPLTLPAGSLPAFSIAMSSPVTNEKDMLPCIMITPSTPSHERDFEVLYFASPTEKSSSCQADYTEGTSFLSSIRSLFSTGLDYHRIRLPETPGDYPYYGQQRRQETRWSAGKRLRTFLFLFTLVFVAVHVFVLPRGGENGGGVFDMLHSPTQHDPAMRWEGWSKPPNAASSLIDDDDLVPTYTLPEAQDQTKASSTATAAVPLTSEL